MSSALGQEASYTRHSDNHEIIDPKQKLLPTPPEPLPLPIPFDSTKTLLSRGDASPNTCHNIQSGTKPTNIFIIKFKTSADEGREYRRNFIDLLSEPGVAFLDLIQQICTFADISYCPNQGCQEIKRKMQNAPACEWERFRDWALVMMSCQMSASDQGLKEESRDWGLVVHNCSIVAQFTSPEKVLNSTNSFEVCELINWISTINCHLNPSYRSKTPLRTHISEMKMLEATQTAQKWGICQNRLWNLAKGGGEREEVDLPILMRMVEDGTQYSARNFEHKELEDRGGLPQFGTNVTDQNLPDLSSHDPFNKSTDHHGCTEEVCQFSIIDSTRVKQLHKCVTKNCDEALEFSSTEFQRPTNRFTWWLGDGNGDNPYVVTGELQEQYMAISHVWSDGTGGGVQGEGRVNRCLFGYFKGIAKELNCKGIWWDTISIPSERVARAKAINQMHNNFKEAAHTVIHDQYLVQFPWTGNGSPCLALLLSPWFTRAWTALELVMSQKEKVWVIYKDPNDPGRHTIKNLERDVLATHPAYSARGHWISSSLVSQLREGQYNSISDITKVLGTRSTSWPRDIMVIAGLLTGHKSNTNAPGFIKQITRDIILGLVEIEESFLYHGHATMALDGGFSWCPFSLLDGRIRTNTDRPDTVYVDENGAVSGAWECRYLWNEEEVTKLRPYSFHIFVAWRIRVTLEKWENCLLLRNVRADDMRVLLVIPKDIGRLEINGEYICPIIDCQYVGTVSANLEWGELYICSVRLGRPTNNLGRSAREIFDQYPESLPLDRHSWLRHLESLKQARRDDTSSGAGLVPLHETVGERDKLEVT